MNDCFQKVTVSLHLKVTLSAGQPVEIIGTFDHGKETICRLLETRYFTSFLHDIPEVDVSGQSIRHETLSPSFLTSKFKRRIKFCKLIAVTAIISRNVEYMIVVLLQNSDESLFENLSCSNLKCCNVFFDVRRSRLQSSQLKLIYTKTLVSIVLKEHASLFGKWSSISSPFHSSTQQYCESAARRTSRSHVSAVTQARVRD